MRQKIEQLKALAEDFQAKTLEEVEALRIKYLSKKGEISALFDEFRNVPNEEKREIGQMLNALRQLATDRINTLRDSLNATTATAERQDLTRTAEPIELGARHPLSLVRNEIIDIFSRIGFTIAYGPEIEDDWHVFSALNFPPEHPARDMQDTFFVEKNPDILLRTHTCTLFLSSDRGFVCRPQRVVCRPQAGIALFCQRDFRRKD